jgi:hypothetical protein
MPYGFLDIAITPSVKAAQAQNDSAHLWEDFKGHREFDRFTESEIAFIAERDSFYMASVSEAGWPYVQHRGGPVGFLPGLEPALEHGDPLLLCLDALQELGDGGLGGDGGYDRQQARGSEGGGAPAAGGIGHVKAPDDGDGSSRC